MSVTPILYKATNTINGKTYIGITDRRFSDRKYEHRHDAKRGSKMPFHNAIRKYGFDAFRWEIVARFATSEEANAAEIIAIRKEKPAYNAAAGGNRAASPANCRRVKCLLDDSVYVSAARAARFYGLSGSLVSLLCRTGGQSTNGLRFTYLDLPKFRQFKGRPGKPVICINDGRVYPSALAAARAYGVDQTSVSGICRRKPKCISARGLVFRFVGDAEDQIDLLDVGARRYMRPVVCCADGRRFDSIGDAAAAYGITLGAVSNVLRGKVGTTGGGLVFRYVDDPRAAEIIPPASERRHSKRVICETDGVEYVSASEAARVYGLDFRTVSALALKPRQSRSGLSFRYIEGVS